jgi:hypothetical protein
MTNAKLVVKKEPHSSTVLFNVKVQDALHASSGAVKFGKFVVTR